MLCISQDSNLHSSLEEFAVCVYLVVHFDLLEVSLVEIAGLEPAASCPPDKRSSQLNYISIYARRTSGLVH